MIKDNHLEIVPDHVSEKDIHDECLRRSARAGYCTRSGEPPYATKIQTIIGWGKEKLNVWPRDKDGHLIGD